ncbi:uncharacterized protein PSFLO_03487 [Pseudozyma flocculosa]|nr:uncharacterized protein PSFLO_03487 [Pseudozyma flocculosa]
MVKAKTDPSAPAAVVQLLDQIEAAGPASLSSPSSSSSRSQLDGAALSETSTSSASKTSTDAAAARSLVATLVALLQRCLDLIYEDERTDELSPSLKYGLDGLRIWANRCAHLAALPPLVDAAPQARAQLLSVEHQLKLSNVIWSACHSERTQIATRSKAVIEAVVALLDRIADPLAERGPVLPFPGDAPFVTDLVSRSFAQLERKQAPIILEVLLAKYGSAPFRQSGPAGASYTDSQIYQRVVRGLGTVDGGANRRSRLALSFLQARAADLGCQLSRKAIAGADLPAGEQSDEAWQRWSAIWLGPLKAALEDGGERLRSGLASYHLAPLFEMDARVFGLLLDSIMRPQGDVTRDGRGGGGGDAGGSDGGHAAGINVEAIFMVLRMGKTQGYCQISGDAADFSTEMGADGSRRVLVPSTLLKDCILSAASELQISTLSLVIESRTPALAFNAAELDILRTFFPYSLTISNPGARGELRGFFVKMLTRLRASSYALARDASKITRIAEHERLDGERVKLAELERDLDAVRRFLEWIYALIRQALHPGASYQACITALTFLDLVLESGIDPRFSQPGAAGNGAARATEKTLTKNAGMTLAKSKQVFVQEFPFTLDLISPALVQLLLSCSESTYDDIQNRALTMLVRFLAPLPGLTERDAAAARILGKAARLMTSSRDFESAAASRLIQLYKAVYIDRLGWPPSSLLELAGFPTPRLKDAAGGQASDNKQIQLIRHHLDLLSHLLSVAESGRILEAATSYPLHGTLVTLQELFASVRLASLPEADRQEFGRAIEEAEAMVDRTWNVTKAVLCNSAPEGSVGDGGSAAAAIAAEENADDGTAGLHQPTHESARAMRIADADGKADGLEQQEESIAGPKHQVILSYSWRGMKEASALLGAIVASTLRGSGSGSGDPTSLWTPASIEAVGARFNLWLTQVRHRGAFSTIYPAYCNAAAAIVRSGWKEVEALPRRWIETFLDAVAQPGTTLSITRRSAGIGYAVLALVSAHPNKTDTSVLLATVRRLIDIAQRGAASSEEGEGERSGEAAPASLPVSAIHALNILRVLVSDGQLSEYMSPFVGQLLELTISKFSSRFWGLRNVSMMLSSSLCIRCFSSRHTNKDTKDARMPVDEFFATYPNMEAFLQRTLEDKTVDAGPSAGTVRGVKQDEQAESSVFAVLMLFSRMQAPELPSSNPRHRERHASFAALIARCASSPVWKIREMAAKAYAAVVPLTTAAEACIGLLQGGSATRQNELHGRLLMVHLLLRSPRESEAPSSSLEPGMSALADALCDGAKRFLVDNRCPATQLAYLEVLQDFVGIRSADYRALGDRVLAAACPWISQKLAAPSAQLQELLRVPHGPSLLSTCARVVLQADGRQLGTSDAGGVGGDSLLRSCVELVSHPIEDVRLSVLEALASDEGSALRRAAASSAVAKQLLCEFGRKIHHSISMAGEGIWVRISAAELLHNLLSGPSADGHTQVASDLASALFPSDAALTDAVAELTRVARTTPIVPLREALLPYIAGLCHALCAATAPEAGLDAGSRLTVVETWCRTVARCADENESVQSREAAGQALRTMGAYLFPAASAADLLGKQSADVFAARLASINLLTDDDEDVRIEAAAMIGETIAVSGSGSGSGSGPATSSRDPGGEDGAKKPSANLLALTRVARSGGASSEVSTDRAWSWMARHYSATATSTVWAEHVWSQLVPTPDASAREFNEAFTPSTMLFTEEKPNQFRDPEATIRRAFASVVSGEVEPASSSLAAQLVERTLGEVTRLADCLGLSSSAADIAPPSGPPGSAAAAAAATAAAAGADGANDVKTDLVGTHLLATRVVLAFTAVQRSGATRAAAVEHARIDAAGAAVSSIVRKLGLDAVDVDVDVDVDFDAVGVAPPQPDAALERETGREQGKPSYSIA